MALTLLLLCAVALVSSRSYGKPATLETRNPSDLLCTCNEISAAISGVSHVFFPRSMSRRSFSHLSHFILMCDQAAPEYFLDISHAASSSSQASTCAVEPGSAEDVSKIVSYLHLMQQLLPIHIFIATYSGIEANTLCGERWRTRYEPRVFLDERS